MDFSPIFLSCPDISFLILFLLVASSNAVNITDGLDGLAGGLSAIAFLAYGLLAWNASWMQGSQEVGIFCFVLVGTLLGFLVFNTNPAKVFMGDTGSLFIGTLIAISIIMSMNYNGENPIVLGDWQIKSNILVFPMCFFLPLADTLRVFVARMRRGKSPFSADKTHIHHFLLRTGYSHQKTTLTTFTTQIIIAIISVLVAFLISDLYYILYIIFMWVAYVFVLRYTVQRKISKIKHDL